MAASRPSILVTRPAARADAFARALRARFGADLNIVTAPIMQIESTGLTDPIPRDAAVIFTSVSAVHAIRDHLSGTGRRAYCVGQNTARAAAEAGWSIGATVADADDLVSALLRTPPDAPLVHLRGTHSRGAVAQRLTGGGVPCTERLVYRQIAQCLTVSAKNLLRTASPVILPLFSPRSAALVAADLPAPVRDLWVATLSPAVTQAWGAAPAARLVEARSPDRPGMLNALDDLISQARTLEGNDGAS